MKSSQLSLLALSAGLMLPGLCDAQKKGVKIKPTVTFAKSWDAAVAEAKMLRMPIVVHSHGFN